MSRRLSIGLLIVAAVPTAAAVPAAAQDDADRPTIGPPIQSITTASAVSTELLGAINGVRELPDGRVLLNDGSRRRLLLLDTTLQTVSVVLDSLSEIANTYGTRVGGLIPFKGDSTLFIDPTSYAIVVLDPAGNIARIRSVWRVEDVTYAASTTGLYGWPGMDARGRVVYRIRAMPAPPSVRPPTGVPYYPQQPDSAFVVAVDLDTRKLDTLGVVRIPRTEVRISQTAEGYFSLTSVFNPLPFTDDWAVLSDGTVAFVRGSDYRIDYLNPDGSRTSSAKLPYDWQRLTDEDKERLVDSVRTVQERSALTAHATAMIRWVNQYGQVYPPGFTVPEGYVPGPGFPRDWMLPPGVTFPPNYIHACDPGVEPATTVTAAVAVSAMAVRPAAGAAGAPRCVPAPVTLSSGVVPNPPARRQVAVMPAYELPDFRPPLPTAAVRADLDGNLWIRTVPPSRIPGGLVYDIVSRQGELVSRIQLPTGYTIAGFGRDRVVYLTMRDATGLHLARVRLR